MTTIPLTNTETNMLIVYSGRDEVLICQPETEQSLLRIWFDAGTARLEDDYNREECPSGIAVVRATLSVDVD